ncbi:MAG TPA: tetratricopeptide repeat protein [Planktothrix sp.]|jgi:tetratricopeptide (TPR) repeat protein
MNKAELQGLLEDISTFKVPQFVDEELAELTARRGASNPRFNWKVFFIAFFTYLGLGWICASLQIPFSPFVFLVVAISIGIPFAKTAAVTRAFNNRQVDRASALLPSAFRWSLWMAPFTRGAITRCSEIQFAILLQEGRTLELELISRYAWAFNEKTPIKTGIPKRSEIANNLALAWLLQEQYEKAAAVFSEKLQQKQQKIVRATLLNNLAFCQVQLKQLDAADQTLNELFQLVKMESKTVTAARMRYVRALLEIELNHLERASELVDEALTIWKGQPISQQMGPLLATLGTIRRKQGRVEEAQLHLHSAVDMMASENNPNCVALARCYQELGLLFCDLDRIEEAQRALEKAHRYYDFYINRETLTVSKLKSRLLAGRNFSSGIDLLTLAPREQLLEVRDN